MLFQMTRKEFVASVELFAELVVFKKFMTDSGEDPQVVLEIIQEAHDKKEIVVFGPGCTYYGETDIFALETKEEEVLEIIKILAKYAEPINGIIGGIFSLAMSIKFVLGSLGTELRDAVKARIAEDLDNMREVRNRTLPFLIWKRQKMDARARFGELDA